ncbi:MAG: glycosyltransferase family 2 protein [Candidatus Aceula meridiana]|nr:glycosyltransferase family 2 protein [Candidatus Aceula meridiana]
MAMDEKKVFVVIPNKNGVCHLSYSLASLAETLYKNFQMVIVDDYSIDGSVAFIEKHYPTCKIIKMEVNKGFAGAVNQGIRYSFEHGADYIAVCNNDVKVLPEWIDLVVDVFRKNKNIGLVGFKEILKEREALFYDWNATSKVKYKEVHGLPGCLYVCPVEIFRAVGLYDESYFMYGEDNDFFLRLNKLSYSLIQTNIPVWHYGEGSSQGQKFFVTWLAYRNALRVAIKNKTFAEIIWLVLSLLNQGCNPFLSNKKDDPSCKRLRRYNIGINFMLILGSCLWNIINIFSTLRARNVVIGKVKERFQGK